MPLFASAVALPLLPLSAAAPWAEELPLAPADALALPAAPAPALAPPAPTPALAPPPPPPTPALPPPPTPAESAWAGWLEVDPSWVISATDKAPAEARSRRRRRSRVDGFLRMGVLHCPRGTSVA